MSTSTYETQQKLEKSFSEDIKDKCAPPQAEISQKKLNQSLKVNQKYIRGRDNQRPRIKCKEWRVKLF